MLSSENIMKFNAINKAEKAYKVELSKVYENRRRKLAVKIVCSIFFLLFISLRFWVRSVSGFSTVAPDNAQFSCVGWNFNCNQRIAE